MHGMAAGSSLVVGTCPGPFTALGPTRKRAPIRSLVRSLAQPTCLKEWAPVVQAVHNGKQTVLLRKGGLREPAFKADLSSSFLLFPTAFHTEKALLQPSAAQEFEQELRYDPKKEEVIELKTGAVVTGIWKTANPGVLEALNDLHIWGPDFLENRLKWRPRDPITIVELRGYRLKEPILLPSKTPGIFGCFSWLQDIPGIDADWLESAEPVLSDTEFAAKQLRCRQGLSSLGIDTRVHWGSA